MLHVKITFTQSCIYHRVNVPCPHRYLHMDQPAWWPMAQETYFPRQFEPPKSPYGSGNKDMGLMQLFMAHHVTPCHAMSR